MVWRDEGHERSRGPGQKTIGYGQIIGKLTTEKARAVQNLIKEVGDAAYKAVEDAVYEEAVRIIEDAQENYVPEDSGDLRDSGRVAVLEWGTGGTSVQFGFGRPGMPYAVAVHETPSAYDPPTWQDTRVRFSKGGPKYLERPLFAAIPGFGTRIAQKARQALRRGGG